MSAPDALAPGTPSTPSAYTPSAAASNEVRLAARLIDTVIELVIAGGLFAVAPDGRPLGADFLVVATVTAYEMCFLTLLGATPGKLALGISVVPVDGVGHPTLAAAFRRSFAVSFCYGVLQSGLLVALTMAGALAASIVLSPHRRAFHDRLSRTVVVRRNTPLPVTQAAIDTWYSVEEAPVFTAFGRAVGLNERRRARAARLDGSPVLVLAVVAAAVAVSAWLQSRWALVWLAAAWLAVFVIDETRRVAATGTTPGHVAAGIEIVDVDTGERPSTARSFARAFVLAPLLYVPPLQLLLAVWVNASRTGRGPHDLAGHTQVVDRHAVARPEPVPQPLAAVWVAPTTSSWATPAAWSTPPPWGNPDWGGGWGAAPAAAPPGPWVPAPPATNPVPPPPPAPRVGVPPPPPPPPLVTGRPGTADDAVRPPPDRTTGPF